MRIALALVATLALGACSGDDKPAADKPADTATTFTVDGTDLAGKCVAGEEPYVIYLHGLGGSSADLDALAEGVADEQPDRGWCVYDRLNVGLSDKSPAPRSLEASVAELDGFLDVANVPGQVVLVGHSYGGLIASSYAGSHPGRVVGLVFADAALPFETGLFTDKVRRTIQRIAEGNREQVDLLASYDAAAQTSLPDVRVLVVDAIQQDLPTSWGAVGYPQGLSAFVRSMPKAELVSVPTNHLGILDSRELVEAVVDTP